MVDVIPCSLPDTQSQQELDWTQETTCEIPKIWGWLYPTRLHLKPLDITKQSITLGRSADCDVILNGTNMNPSTLRFISKHHFRIFCVNSDGSTVMYLEDSSHNGTFVNGIKIDRGNKVILQNGDEISVGHPTMKIYVFKCINDFDLNYPKEISSKYVVSRLLGSGACGEVRLVWNKRNSERYAMKKITKSKFTQISKRVNNPHRVLNEIKILKALNHPFVIRMEDIVESDDAFYIILELMEGGELFERIISTNGVPESETKFIFYQIVLAVKYLHEQGITHRDLKPENILLSSANSPEPLVKVTDFGLSKFVEEESMMKTLCGTPMYLAPEIILTQGRGTYTKQIDVWSLGVILYVLLSGYLPFSCDDPNMPLSDQIINGAYSFPKSCFQDISNNAIDLIENMLIVNPKNRITMDQILRHPWFDDQIMISKVNKLLENNDALSDSSGECLEPQQKRVKLQ